MEGIVMGLKHLCLAAATLLALPAIAAISEPAGLAPALRVSLDEEPAFVLSGNGVQVYQCRLGLSVPDSYLRSFVAPYATLYEGSRTAARRAYHQLRQSSLVRHHLTHFPRYLQ